MIAHIESAIKLFCTYTASAASLRLNCYALFQKYQASTCMCTSTWVALSNICVTTTNMRNVFYYKISEHAHCTQHVQLLFTHAIQAVWAAPGWLTISEHSEKSWSFPQCLGAMDGKHAVLQAPVSSRGDFTIKSQHSALFCSLLWMQLQFPIRGRVLPGKNLRWRRLQEL